MDKYIKLSDAKEALFPEEKTFSSIGFWEYQCDVLDTVPLADVKPVVHATWIDYDYAHAIGAGVKYKMCSACKEHIAHLGQDLRFCPNCGADMSDGKEHKIIREAEAAKEQSQSDAPDDKPKN